MPLFSRSKPVTAAAFTDADGQAWRLQGTGPAIEALRPNCQAAGLVPASQPNGPSPSTPRVVLLADLDQRRNKPARYLDTFAALHEELPADAVLHHPAILTGLAGLSDTGRWAVTGYPGAGNMVLQGVLGQIDLLMTEKKQDPTADRAVLLGQHHGQVIHETVRRLLHEVAQPTKRTVEDFTLAPGHLGQCSVRAKFTDGTVLLMNHLPYAGFLGNDYGAHSRWTLEAAAFFKRFGYRRVYHAVRDPLAVLCSNAAKTVRPLEHALHDPGWFTPTARQLASYLRSAQDVLEENPDAFKVVRYEDLTGKPRETIQELGCDAGLELTDEQADAIWDKVGFKSLTPAGDEHLFNPTADKRPHYRARHLDLMRDVGLNTCFEMHGYATPAADQLPAGELEPVEKPDKTPSALYGRIDPRSMHERKDPYLPLWIRSNDADLPALVAEQLKTTYLGRIMQTLGDTYGRLALPGG